MTYYDEISSGYDELHRDEQIRKIKVILRNVEIKGKILDVGCGSCFLYEMIKDKENYFGIDPSIELLKTAKKRMEKEKIKLIQGIGEKLPFKDKMFDFVVCLSAIHNFEDVDSGLDEMKRVGSKYVISIIKKIKDHDRIISKIKERFKIITEIDDRTDSILILE